MQQEEKTGCAGFIVLYEKIEASGQKTVDSSQKTVEKQYDGYSGFWLLLLCCARDGHNKAGVLV
jgi:hypothetical protein